MFSKRTQSEIIGGRAIAATASHDNEKHCEIEAGQFPRKIGVALPALAIHARAEVSGKSR
jgi:hypothetical protein